MCKTCQAIPLAIFQDGATAKHHLLWLTFSAFANSASRGCHTCTLLYEAVREPFKDRLDDEPIYLEHAILNADGGQAVALTVDLASSPNRRNWDESLWRHTDEQGPSFQFVPLTDVRYVPDARG